MRRLIAGSIVVGCLLAAAPAASANVPAVLTGSATSVTNTTATLNGTVKAGGKPTSYAFQYGLSSSYTSQTRSHSAGSGFTNLKVKAGIGRLIPGTVYHFRVVAVNASGLAVGADHTFKTHGHPPPAVLTGPALGVSPHAATLTGFVGPGGLATTYRFQFGTAPFSVSQTPAVTLAATSAIVPVTAPLTFLADHTLYHYRLIASNSTGTRTGADRVFATSPFTPGLTRNARPRHRTRPPFRIAIGGELQPPAGFPPDQACTGVVQIVFRARGRTVTSAQVFVGSNCRYGTIVIVPRSTRGTVHMRARFLGNDLLTPQSARTQNLRLG